MAEVSGITVSELVTLLGEYDGAHRVVIPSAEGGFFDLSQLEARMISLNVNAFPGAGPHDVAHYPAVDPVAAVVFHCAIPRDAASVQVSDEPLLAAGGMEDGRRIDVLTDDRPELAVATRKVARRPGRKR